MSAKEPAKRSHAAFSDLKNTVEEGKKRLANVLEDKALGLYARCISRDWITLTNLISSTKRDHEIKDTLIKVILDAQRTQTEFDERVAKHFSTASASFQSGKSNIAFSRELLRDYERASQQVACRNRVPMMESEWEKDSQTLQRILNKQGEKIKLQVHQFLIEDPNSLKEQVKGDISELDTSLWTRFAMGDAQEENFEPPDGRKEETWAVVAKNAQRGVRRTVKNLPEDGE